MRVFHAMAAIDEVNRRDKMPAVRAAAVADGIRAAADAGHLAPGRGGGIASAVLRRDPARRARERPRAPAPSWPSWSTTARAGDHRRARRACCCTCCTSFGLAAMIKPPVITWSAGAMALSDRVVLFGDRPPGRTYGCRRSWADGLGVYSGVLPFPHPRHRLPMHDPYQLALLARRFKGWTCLLFDDGVRVDLTDGWPPPVGAGGSPGTARSGPGPRARDRGAGGIPVDDRGQPARRPADADASPRGQS